jgi:hypothetical protein
MFTCLSELFLGLFQLLFLLVEQDLLFQLHFQLFSLFGVHNACPFNLLASFVIGILLLECAFVLSVVIASVLASAVCVLSSLIPIVVPPVIISPVIISPVVIPSVIVPLVVIVPSFWMVVASVGLVSPFTVLVPMFVGAFFAFFAMFVFLLVFAFVLGVGAFLLVAAPTMGAST